MGLSAVAGMVGQVVAAEAARQASELASMAEFKDVAYYDKSRKRYVSGPATRTCPNCGAPKHSNTCEYCHT